MERSMLAQHGDGCLSGWTCLITEPHHPARSAGPSICGWGAETGGSGAGLNWDRNWGLCGNTACTVLSAPCSLREGAGVQRSAHFGSFHPHKTGRKSRQSVSREVKTPLQLSYPKPVLSRAHGSREGRFPGGRGSQHQVAGVLILCSHTWLLLGWF